MLIPGIPVAGAQIDPVKAKRGVQAAEQSATVQETLSEPVERRRRNKGRSPERRRARKRARLLEYTPEGKVESFSDFPTKGLLVDIEV